ncbi:MAG: glycosyltransferase [Bacteroidetes bacterium]|nr:glycosyltransferase [Rhodothermia bacterium]MCX7907249.1 glycosyltransferase [Bacteroidota bacterium]MDW8286123.1 glycosyltransferase [Bacteroidota bacterium]
MVTGAPRSRPRAVLLGLGPALRDSRTLREAELLEALGWEVHLVGYDAAQAQGPWPVHRLTTRFDRGPARFWAHDRAARRLLGALPAELYQALDLYSLPACAWAADRWGAALTYDARELYPDVAATVGRPWVRAFWRALEARYIRRAHWVFTVSEGIAELLALRYEIPKPLVVRNVPAYRPVPPSRRLRERLRLPSEAFLFLHQGHMQRGRGLERLLVAFGRANLADAHLVLLGEGPLRGPLQERVRRLGLSGRVWFLDPVAPAELLAYTASADVGVSLLEDTCLNHRYALPNKLFEYLMAGLPVLASDLPEIRAIVAGFDVGLLVDPRDPEMLREAIERMRTDDAARRRWRERTRAVFDVYRWEFEARLLQSVYERLP